MAHWNDFALVANIGSCLFMTGVILLIQLAHYPMFPYVEKVKFAEFHRLHSKALGITAGPVMTLELISAIWLAKDLGHFFVVNLVGVITLWLITFFVSVPEHNKLAQEFSDIAWRLRHSKPSTRFFRVTAFSNCSKSRSK